MRNVKRLLCLILALALLCAMPVVSAEERSLMDKIPYADALNSLGLFLGTDKGYELDASLTREQAITLVVRFMGKEAAALEENNPHPFTDVSAWASPYVGYAYVNGITKGVAATRFGASEQVTEGQFLTFLLRLLGYVDGEDFSWEAPWCLAKVVGLVPDSLPQTTPFTRGCAVVLCWRLLQADSADGGSSLYSQLISDGIFSSSDWSDAKKLTSDGEKNSETSNGIDFIPEIDPPDSSGGSSGETDSEVGGETGSGVGGGTDSGVGGGTDSNTKPTTGVNETENVILP